MFKIMPIARIEARVLPWRWAWADDNQTRIEAHWQTLSACNPALYDGEVLMLCDGAVDGNSYRGSYFKTRFSRFIAWRDWGYPDPSVRNGFAMNALQSEDGAYLLGVMAAHTSNAGKMYFPAGTPDLSDVVGDRVDLSGSAVRELCEETGFGEDDLKASTGWTLVEGARQVAYLRHCRLKYPIDDALARFGRWQEAQTKPELSALYPVRNASDLQADRMHDYLLHWFRQVMA